MKHISSPIIEWCESKLLIPDLDPEFRISLVEFIQKERQKLSTGGDCDMQEN